MAGAQQESTTQVNQGAGASTASGQGDLIRDFVITLPDGTTAKIQAISVVDPVNPTAIQRVSGDGAMVASPDLNSLVTNLIAHIKALGRMQASELGQDFDLLVQDALDEVAA